MVDLPRLTAMWLLSFAVLTSSLQWRPDGPKLTTTTGHRRGPDPALTTPLRPSDRAKPAYRTATRARTNRIAPDSSVAHRDATAPSNPDPAHFKHKTRGCNKAR